MSATGSVRREAEVVPASSANSTRISPPICSMMRLQIASPSPVPPKRRLIEEFGLGEIAEQLADLLGRDADAGVADRAFEWSRRPAVEAARRDLHDARVGELDRIGHQVEHDLADPGLVADQRGRHRVVDVQRSGSPFLVALASTMLATLSITARSENGAASNSILPASSLETIQDVVQQREQVVAGFVDRLGDVPLIVVELGVEQRPRTGRSRRSSACGSRGSSPPGTRLRLVGGDRRLLLTAQPLRKAVQVALRAGQP